MNSLHAVIAVWLNASLRRQVGVGMNRSARGVKCKVFEQSFGLDTALYMNVPLLYLIKSTMLCILCIAWVLTVLEVSLSVAWKYCQLVL